MFRRIATLAIASELNGAEPGEILRMAFVRARFCEQAAGLCAFDATEQYLLGMFSMLPAMLQTTMAEIVNSLPLQEKIRRALLGEPIDKRWLLQWAEARERGEWPRCEAVAQSYGIQMDRLQHCFSEAVVWADETLLAQT